MRNLLRAIFSSQQCPALVPVGQKAVHELVEASIVTRFEHVDELMHYYVFQATRRIERQTRVDAHASGAG